MIDVNVERRRTDPTVDGLFSLIASVNGLHEKLDALEEVKVVQRAMQRDLSEHVEREEELFLTAFPDGDPDGHRRAHEAQILAAEQKAQFWQRMAIKAGEMTVWGFLICLAGVVIYFWNGHMPASAQIPMPGAK